MSKNNSDDIYDIITMSLVLGAIGGAAICYYLGSSLIGYLLSGSISGPLFGSAAAFKMQGK